MQGPILALVAVFLTCGLYLMLDRTLLRVVIGLGLLSNGVNLMLLATGGLGRVFPPILEKGRTPVADPLPQALILTAIVIGLGVTALALTIASAVYSDRGSDDLGEMHGRLNDE
ncbi:MAG: NADH-quinone oxidoreductase subunit K [Candidatus Binatia bacterium]